MAYEVRDLSGSIFKSTRKTKETQPDYDGSCRIEGVDYWVSMWTKQGRSGEFFSLAFKKKDGTTARPEPQNAETKAFVASQTNPGVKSLLDDDVPF